MDAAAKCGLGAGRLSDYSDKMSKFEEKLTIFTAFIDDRTILHVLRAHRKTGDIYI